MVQIDSGSSVSQNNSPPTQGTGSNQPNASQPTIDPMSRGRPSVATKVRPNGKNYRPITPLEALYYHERLDLITHPLIKGNRSSKISSQLNKIYYHRSNQMEMG